MKKLAPFLLILLMVVAGIFYMARSAIVPKDDDPIVQPKSTAPLSSFLKDDSVVDKTVTRSFEPSPPLVEERH